MYESESTSLLIHTHAVVVSRDEDGPIQFSVCLCFLKMRCKVPAKIDIYELTWRRNPAKYGWMRFSREVYDRPVASLCRRRFKRSGLNALDLVRVGDIQPLTVDDLCAASNTLSGKRHLLCHQRISQVDSCDILFLAAKSLVLPSEDTGRPESSTGCTCLTPRSCVYACAYVGWCA